MKLGLLATTLLSLQSHYEFEIDRKSYNPVKNGMRQGTKGWKVRTGNVYKELGNAFSSGSLENYLDETFTCMVQNS